ncbi:MAG TPA: tyrosine-type recombinase/integrase [Anaerolineales bacterium]|nr:tyrosine-type recombinase/integrase [Anaerolineales bacterium]
MNLIEEYRLHLVKRDRSEKTIHGYTTDLAQFQKWLGAKPLTAITEVDVRSYRDHMLKQGNSPNTINRRIASLASFGDWGVQDGVFKRNPAQYVKPVKVMELAPRWLNEEQKKKLLAVVEHDLREARERYPRLWVLRKRDAVIVHTLLLTGLRVDELCSLALSDLTLSERKGTLLVRQGKGGKQRVVMLMNETRKQLGEWLAVRPQVEGDALFVGQTGEGIRPRLVQRLVERYSKMAGLEGVTPHSLRHTYARSLLDSGARLQEVAKLMGHGRLDSTARYVQPSEDDLREVVERLEGQG